MADSLASMAVAASTPTPATNGSGGGGGGPAPNNGSSPTAGGDKPSGSGGSNTPPAKRSPAPSAASTGRNTVSKMMGTSAFEKEVVYTPLTVVSDPNAAVPLESEKVSDQPRISAFCTLWVSDFLWVCLSRAESGAAETETASSSPTGRSSSRSTTHNLQS